MWSSLMAKLSDTPFTAYMADFPEDKAKYVNPYKELALSLFKQSDHTITSIVYAIFDQMKNKNSPEVQYYVDMIDEVKKELSDLLSDDAVFLYPMFPSYAPKHGRFFFSLIQEFCSFSISSPPRRTGTTILKAHNAGYTAIFNVLSLPATQCPFMLHHETNMPVGFQVVATPFNGRFLIFNLLNFILTLLSLHFQQIT